MSVHAPPVNLLSLDLLADSNLPLPCVWQVALKAICNGVDPSILDRPTEEIRVSSKYFVMGSGRVNIRVSPHLDSPLVVSALPLGTVLHTAQPPPQLPSGAATVVESLGTILPDESPERDVGSSAAAAYSLDPLSQGGVASSSPKQALSKNPEVHGEDLVGSGWQVWVVSPVVGWASAWTEDGQRILRPVCVFPHPAGSATGGMGQEARNWEGGLRLSGIDVQRTQANALVIQGIPGLSGGRALSSSVSSDDNIGFDSVEELDLEELLNPTGMTIESEPSPEETVEPIA
ncbi:unnamed protein product [Choristocarpus tenellus]